MARRSVLTVAVCAALAALGSFGLAACDDASPSQSAGSPDAKSDAARYAWAVGSQGIIMATTDSGTHWSAQEPGTDLGLSGVSFADAMHGWAVGGYPDVLSDLKPVALILATTDGGNHWVAQSQAAGEPLGRVACTDASHVWVTGGGQTAKVLASSDGGKTWTTQYADDAAGQIRDITFTDGSHGWAIKRVGSWSDSRTADVLATTDGGAHWRVQATLRGDSTDWAVAFADSSHGWIVGSLFAAEHPNHVWVTSDGGTTWTPAPAPQGMIANLEDVACSGVEHVWIGATGPDVFFRSTNGGRTWLAPSKPIDDAGVMALAFSDAARGWVVTLNGALTRILGTTDGGDTWTRQARVGQPTGNPPQLVDITCLPAAGGSDE